MFEIYIASVIFFTGFFYRVAYEECDYSLTAVLYALTLGFSWPAVFLSLYILNKQNGEDNKES